MHMRDRHAACTRGTTSTEIAKYSHCTHTFLISPRNRANIYTPRFHRYTFLEEMFAEYSSRKRTQCEDESSIGLFANFPKEWLIFKRNFLSSPCVPRHVQRMRRIFLLNARGEKKVMRGSRRTHVSPLFFLVDESSFGVPTLRRPCLSRNNVTKRTWAFLRCDCQMRGWWQPRREGEHRRAIIW